MSDDKKEVACYHLPDFPKKEKVAEELKKHNIKIVRPLPTEDAFSHFDNNISTCQLVVFRFERGSLHNNYVQWAHDVIYNRERQTTEMISVFPSEVEANKHPSSVREPDCVIYETPEDAPKDDFEERLLAKIIDRISQESQNVRHPVGNISAGFAVNYYTGPLKTLLSEQFQNEFHKNSDKKSVVSGMVTVILVPKDLALLDSDLLERLGEKTVVQIETVFNGNKRIFSGSKYKIKAEDGTERYISVDMPSILSCLQKLPNGNGLTPEHVKKYRSDFIHELKILLNKEHEFRYIIVEFDADDDLKKKINDRIDRLAELKKDRKDTEWNRVVLLKPEEEDSELTTVYSKFENQLRSKENNLEIVSSQANKNVGDSSREGAKHGATVFVFIEHGKLTSPQYDMVKDLVDQQSPSKRLQLIPVFLGREKDTQNDEDSGKLNPGNHLANINSLYLKECINGENGMLTEKGQNEFSDEIQKAIAAAKGTNPLNYPIGPVFIGLAWTSILNYLVPVLKEKVDGMRAIQDDRRFEGATKFPKLILLAESQCRTSRDLSKLPGFEVVGTHPVTKEVAGTTRTYDTYVYKVTHKDKDYIVGIEYVRALACLGEIEKTLQVGISPYQKSEQCEKFGKKYEELITKYGLDCAYCIYEEEKFTDKMGNVNLAQMIAEFVEKPEDSTTGNEQ